MSEQGDILHVSGGFVGKAQTHPSTLYMDGTSPVTVKIQATTDELRELHNQQVRIVPVDVRPILGGHPLEEAADHVLNAWSADASPDLMAAAIADLARARQLDIPAVSGD